eukprot:TRINITY_DN4851_c3_g1_i1.p2 TRINITY_DN4851_c3_g1~~TRINITY_DN4851_c3_g1_i1.p2  ORF type:complete len:432 (+),score=77.37 TRINITY_DN4851_c3_g1_i1:88-1383(+)
MQMKPIEHQHERIGSPRDSYHQNARNSRYRSRNSYGSDHRDSKYTSGKRKNFPDYSSSKRRKVENYQGTYYESDSRHSQSSRRSSSGQYQQSRLSSETKEKFHSTEAGELINDRKNIKNASSRSSKNALESKTENIEVEKITDEEKLPAQSEVIKQMERQDNEIARLEEQLKLIRLESNSLKKRKSPFLKVVSDLEPKRNLLIENPLIAEIYQSNKRVATQSHEEYSESISNIPNQVIESTNNKTMRNYLITKISKDNHDLDQKKKHLQAIYSEKVRKWKVYLEEKSNESPKFRRRRTGKRRLRSGNTPERPSLEDIRERVSLTIAPIPPMILDVKRRKTHFIDNNRLVRDSEKFLNDTIIEEAWLPEEEELFLQLYSKYPKDFDTISKKIANKSLKNCIKFYYVNKYRLKLNSLGDIASKRIHVGMEYLY